MQKKIKECISLVNSMSNALVAQLDRASDYGSEGCEFESRRARHLEKPPEAEVFLMAGKQGDLNSQEVSSTTSERRAKERRSA